MRASDDETCAIISTRPCAARASVARESLPTPPTIVRSDRPPPEPDEAKTSVAVRGASTDRPAAKAAPAGEGPTTVAPRSASPAAPCSLPAAPPAMPPLPAALPAAVLPPPLATQVYALVKRLAMQHTVLEADRVLRAAVAELTGSPAVFVVMHDGKEPFVAEGGFPPPELVRPEAIAQTAREQRPVVAPRLALFPILAATQSIGVIVIGRPPQAPAYAPADLGVAAAVAHECAGLLNNLVAGRRRDDAAAKDSLFRPEAIHHFRHRGAEGPVFRVSPGWVRWAYPTLLALVGGALLAAALIDVPTYSTGSAIVMIEGHRVTAR